MNLNNIFKKISTSLCDERILRDIKFISSYDRYQASHGIWEVAYYLYNQLTKLRFVESYIHSFDVSDNIKWWEFDAPLSWTPILARCEIYIENKLKYLFDHKIKPCTIATNSTGWDKTRSINKVVIFDITDFNTTLYKDAFVIIKKNQLPFSKIIELLEKAGAYGFITDYFSRIIDSNHYVGRVELPFKTKLFGFSTSSEIIDALVCEQINSFVVIPEIIIDTNYSMPIVETFLNLGGTEEIWLIAHLCHPRPGANDNASGAAGLLEIIRILTKDFHNTESVPYSIRFIWAPEFSGTAAYLYSKSLNNFQKLPKFVINLDMIGENLKICESKFIIERPPLFNISYHICILEKIAQLFCNYISDLGEKFDYKISDFIGYSDHAIFADMEISAIQLCHFPDIYNHTSGDCLDNIDIKQLHKILVFVSSFIYVLLDLSLSCDTKIEQILILSEEWILREWENLIKNLPQSQIYYIKDLLNSFFSSLEYLTTNSYINKVRLSKINKKFDVLEKFPVITDSYISRNWKGPFNPRGFLNILDLEEKTSLMYYIHEQKFYYSILLQTAILIRKKNSKIQLLEYLKIILKTKMDLCFVEKILFSMIKNNWVIYEEL